MPPATSGGRSRRSPARGGAGDDGDGGGLGSLRRARRRAWAASMRRGGAGVSRLVGGHGRCFLPGGLSGAPAAASSRGSGGVHPRLRNSVTAYLCPLNGALPFPDADGFQPGQTRWRWRRDRQDRAALAGAAGSAHRPLRAEPSALADAAETSRAGSTASPRRNWRRGLRSRRRPCAQPGLAGTSSASCSAARRRGTAGPDQPF